MINQAHSRDALNSQEKEDLFLRERVKNYFQRVYEMFPDNVGARSLFDDNTVEMPGPTGQTQMEEPTERS